MHQLNRRQLLASSAIALLLSSRVAQAALVKGALPWRPGAADPPAAVTPDGWHYFTPHEAATVEAFVDRLIPPDPQTPGGKDCGCAVFIDRQLAGPYGRNEAFYMMGPFQEGTKQQGPQSALTTAQQYRKALAAFDAACREQIQRQDLCRVVRRAEGRRDQGPGGRIVQARRLRRQRPSSPKSSRTRRHGFLADPIYGGNKDMAAWKMIGFPGAHYDYRDWIDRHNQRVTLPVVGINNHPNWSQ